MMEISTHKSVSNRLGDYNSRTYQGKAWTKAEYEFENNRGELGRQYGVRDWSRASLNFEVVKKNGILTVQPIDHSKPSLQERWQRRIDEGYKAVVNTKTGPKKKPIRKTEIKMVMFDLGGHRGRMHELAFDREVKLGKRGIGLNGDVRRKADIEQWAKDCYEFMAKKYGAENIIDFVVHLDETNPHVHCIIVPLTRDGKLSYTELFGGSHAQATARAAQDGSKPSFRKGISDYHLALHSEFAREVGDKWGLERGDDIKITGNTHKSTAESLREKNALEEEIAQKSNSVLTLTNRQTQLQSKVENLEEAERRADENLTTKNKLLSKMGVQIVRPTTELEDENERLRREKELADKIAKEKEKTASEATKRANSAYSEGAAAERKKDIAYDGEGKPIRHKDGTPWTNSELRSWYTRQHKDDERQIKALTAKVGLMKGLIVPIIEAAINALRWLFAYPHIVNNSGIDEARAKTIDKALSLADGADKRLELGKSLIALAHDDIQPSKTTLTCIENEMAKIANGTHKHLSHEETQSIKPHR